MVEKAGFKASGVMAGNSQVAAWSATYGKLDEEGKIFRAAETGRITVERSAGLIGVEFMCGGFSAEKTVLKNFPDSLPPENGIHGTSFYEPGSDAGKTVFFFDVANPRTKPGDVDTMQFSTSYCDCESQDNEFTIHIK
ncbi:MAG: hypothetical protein RDV48_30125 [Candidatus Eremiobacteraeota bacterium]|nr:hypothetical protein [Candidatus Eremiobacteraeota bacterium]